MFHDLDTALANLLNDANAPGELVAAFVNFETPDKTFAPAANTVNLFLYVVNENRELRQPEPIVERVGPSWVRRPAPIRVDCGYMVTAWSVAQAGVRVAEEHQLLAQALGWLSRFPTIPPAYLPAGLANQPLPLPTLVAHVDGKNAGEFWTALGVAPRPAFQLSVTLSMDFGLRVPAGPPVVTREFRYGHVPPGAPPPALGTVFAIGGTVRDANTLVAVAGAAVTILPPGRQAQSDAQGRFRLTELEAGNYALSVAAPGYAVQNFPIVVPAAALNAYDVALT